MLEIAVSSRFKKDMKKLEKRGKQMVKLRKVLTLLINEEPIPAEYRDHPLRGDWIGFRDLHLELVELILHSHPTLIHH